MSVLHKDLYLFLLDHIACFQFW